MPFTEREKRKWHADRKREQALDQHEGAEPLAMCGHCGNPFNDGVVTSDFALCDVCNGD